MILVKKQIRLGFMKDLNGHLSSYSKKIPAQETFIVINWISEIYYSLANFYYLFKLNDQDMVLK